MYLLFDLSSGHVITQFTIWIDILRPLLPASGGQRCWGNSLTMARTVTFKMQERIPKDVHPTGWLSMTTGYKCCRSTARSLQGVSSNRPTSKEDLSIEWWVSTHISEQISVFENGGKMKKQCIRWGGEGRCRDQHYLVPGEISVESISVLKTKRKS